MWQKEFEKMYFISESIIIIIIIILIALGTQFPRANKL